MKPGAYWTTDRIDLTRKLFDMGRSATQIADELMAQFGSTCSRNMVCSKLVRLGLVRATTQEARKQKPRIRIVAANMNSASLRIIEAHQPTVQPKLRAVEIEPIGIELINLRRHHCRYPDDSSPVRYCGHTKREGSSYCPAHAYLCRQASFYQR